MNIEELAKWYEEEAACEDKTASDCRDWLSEAVSETDARDANLCLGVAVRRAARHRATAAALRALDEYRDTYPLSSNTQAMCDNMLKEIR